MMCVVTDAGRLLVTRAVRGLADGVVSVVLASLRSTALLRFRFVTHSDGAVT